MSEAHDRSQFYTTPPSRGSSAAAVDDDVRVDRRTGSISAAAPAPRERLSPCKRLAVFDGRRASFTDSRICGIDHEFPKRFFVIAGYIVRPSEPNIHGDSCCFMRNCPVDLDTDDPAEAEAAYERGERWVRTGELDEG